MAPIIDLSQSSLLLSIAAIAFNPTAWNIVAQNGEPEGLASRGDADSVGRVP
jgi:hypothetical protein